MNIGVDVDGVLEDLHSFLFDSGTKFFKKKYDMAPSDPTAGSIEEMFRCTEEQRRAFWWACGAEYLLRRPCREGCKSTLARLRKNGHRVYIITCRALTVGRGAVSLFFRLILRFWLMKNGLRYDGIAFCSGERTAEDKRRACEKLKIDVMIDDSVPNLDAVKDLARPVLFTAPWNSGAADPDVTRVNSWSEVEQALRLA